MSRVSCPLALFSGAARVGIGDATLSLGWQAHQARGGPATVAFASDQLSKSVHLDSAPLDDALRAVLALAAREQHSERALASVSP